MHAYIIVCVFVPVHVHVCVFKWKPENISGIFISDFPVYFGGQSHSLTLVRLAAQQSLGILLSLPPYWNYECKAAYSFWELNLGPHAAVSNILPTKLSLHLFPIYFSTVVEPCYHFTPHFWGHDLSWNLHFLGFSCMLPMAGITSVHWYAWVLHDFEDSFCRYDKRALHIWIWSCYYCKCTQKLVQTRGSGTYL